MRFNSHSELEGRHAFLSPSKYHWTNYSEEKLDYTYKTQLAAQRGTDMHTLAMMAIRLNQRFPRTPGTMNDYINDAIGFRMTPEVPLFYSRNCFGTADTISFRNNLLRIHDLKSGKSPTSMKQLMIYAALFCLEYGYKPTAIEIELRIYQNDAIEILNPESEDIVRIMSTIIAFDQRIEKIREEADL